METIKINPVEIETKYVDAQGNELVAVVHCKDCKWYKESKYSELRPMRFCYRLRNNDGVRVGYNWDGNDFCSYGERREDADALINDVTERYCKDCEYGEPNGQYGCKCYHHKLYEIHEMSPNDFCSKGKRKEDAR